MKPTVHRKLTELLALPSETEWVEFKEARRNYSFDKVGKYFSALSNEANLKEQEYGWLVFGVQDKSHYQKLIIDYLMKFGPSPRNDIDAFLLEKLSDTLSHKQKKNKIRNLLQEMRMRGKIQRGEKTSSGA